MPVCYNKKYLSSKGKGTLTYRPPLFWLLSAKIYIMCKVSSRLWFHFQIYIQVVITHSALRQPL